MNQCLRCILWRIHPDCTPPSIPSSSCPQPVPGGWSGSWWGMLVNWSAIVKDEGACPRVWVRCQTRFHLSLLLSAVKKGRWTRCHYQCGEEEQKIMFALTREAVLHISDTQLNLNIPTHQSVHMQNNKSGEVVKADVIMLTVLNGNLLNEASGLASGNLCIIVLVF